jgi:hypothetical protein
MSILANERHRLKIFKDLKAFIVLANTVQIRVSRKTGGDLKNYSTGEILKTIKYGYVCLSIIENI